MHKYILIKCVFVGLRPSGHFTDLKATKYINGPLIFPSPLLNVLIIYGKSTKCPKDRLKIFLSESKSVFLRSLVDLNLESLRGSKKRENIEWLTSQLCSLPILIKVMVGTTIPPQLLGLKKAKI